MSALRALLLDMPLVETFKWRQPVYTSDGANITIIWAFKESCGLGFFKGALLADPKGLLQAPGPNSRAARKLPLYSLDDIQAHATQIRAFVENAIRVEKAGLKVPAAHDDLEYPPELDDALASDPKLAEAFAALTPGRRRGYVLNIAAAKRSETRAARIQKFAPRIMEGLGLHDR